jgi:zinc protease
MRSSLRSLRAAALALLVITASTLAGAQATAPRKFPLNATLPLAPDIRTGTLPNGLKFYIRKNGRPEKRRCRCGWR